MEDLLTENEILLFKGPINNKVKLFIVYFLIRDNKIVYIGKSSFINDRIKSHISLKQKDFDSYTTILYDSKYEMDEEEKLYIRKFKPEYNIDLY